MSTPLSHIPCVAIEPHSLATIVLHTNLFSLDWNSIPHLLDPHEIWYLLHQMMDILRVPPSASSTGRCRARAMDSPHATSRLRRRARQVYHWACICIQQLHWSARDNGRREGESGPFVGWQARVQDEREFPSVAVPRRHLHQCVSSSPGAAKPWLAHHSHYNHQLVFVVPQDPSTLPERPNTSSSHRK